MNKNGTLAERLALLEKRCGSQRALARFLDVKDVTIMRWKRGLPALPTKLAHAAMASGLSLDWLENGNGDPDRELSKARPLSAKEAAQRVKDIPSLEETVAFIQEHGDADDLAMIDDVLKAASRRIRNRTGADPTERREGADKSYPEGHG